MKEKTSAGPGDGGTQDSSVPASSTWWGWAVEPGTDPWWKEAETGDRGPGANSGTHLKVFPGGEATLTASLVCASARWYQPVGVSESSLHCSCPATFSTATDTCRGPSPAEAQAGRDRRHCRGPWESSLLAPLATSPLLSAFPCRPLTPRSLPCSPHPPVSPACPPGQLLGCLLPVSLLIGTAII